MIDFLTSGKQRKVVSDLERFCECSHAPAEHVKANGSHSRGYKATDSTS
jgi:hypothetical protein